MTTMTAPAAFAKFAALSGTVYTADADGHIANVAPNDVKDLIAGGCTFAGSGVASTKRVPLINFKNADGTTLAASAASGKFGLAITGGTSENLAGEGAQSNTKTDTAAFEYVLPSDYVAGTDITLTFNAKIAGSGTAGGTKTIAAAAYLNTDAGAEGATLIATAAQNLTSSSADYAFTITGTTLTPGARLLITVTTALQETGGSATVNSQINSARLSA